MKSIVVLSLLLGLFGLTHSSERSHPKKHHGHKTLSKHAGHSISRLAKKSHKKKREDYNDPALANEEEEEEVSSQRIKAPGHDDALDTTEPETDQFGDPVNAEGQKVDANGTVIKSAVPLAKGGAPINDVSGDPHKPDLLLDAK